MDSQISLAGHARGAGEIIGWSVCSILLNDVFDISTTTYSLMELCDP